MRILFTSLFLAALAMFASAIPQTITSGTFGSAAGLSFEQFASARTTWAPGAALAGSWSPPAADGARTLAETAVVFGLPAAEVRAEESRDRLTRLRVVFRESGQERRTLFTRVTQGIAAFTGHPARTEDKEARVFRHEQTQIRATPAGEGEVVVEFTPVP